MCGGGLNIAWTQCKQTQPLRIGLALFEDLECWRRSGRCGFSAVVHVGSTLSELCADLPFDVKTVKLQIDDLPFDRFCQITDRRSAF
jgi:hypothetical protein